MVADSGVERQEFATQAQPRISSLIALEDETLPLPSSTADTTMSTAARLKVDLEFATRFRTLILPAPLPRPTSIDREAKGGASVAHDRLTAMCSWAPQVRRSVTAGWSILCTRTRALLPPAVV